MNQPITILDALVILCVLAGGFSGGAIIAKVIMGYVRGMPKW